MKRTRRIGREPFEALSDIPVIDAHEHLVPEATRVAGKVGFITVMAKEIACRALGKRISGGQMNLEEAVRIAKLWFHDNAVRIYHL